MKIKLKERYKYRAESVLNNLRLCNSAADVHTVGNMRNTAELLIDAIDCDIMPEKRVVAILKQLENDELSFFRKKFGK